LVWVREVLLGAAENDFSGLPTCVAQEVLDVARGFPSTKIIEDSGNRLRSSERLHSASKLGRVARWHLLLHAGVIEGFDRKQIAITPQDKVRALSQLNKDIFEAKRGNFSLGEESLNKFMSGELEFRHPAPQNLHDSVMLTTSVRLLGGDVERLRKCWLGLLAHRGRVLVTRNADGKTQASVVVMARDWGVLTVPVVAKRVGGVKFFRLEVDPERGAYE
jgi:hypothetical protein